MKDKHGFIAISAIWYERFLECSRTYGTGEYPSSVWRFYHSLLNLGTDELSIKNIIQNYVENDWEKMTQYLLLKQTRYTTDSDVINHNRKQIELQHVHLVFDMIVQTIQDSGIGWTDGTNATIYDKSGIDTDPGIESRTIKAILHARKTNGLYSQIITGKRGIGKSSYALQVLFRIFRTLGYEVDESWNMALNRILYKVPEVVDFLDRSSDKEHKDIFIWDDAGVFAGGVRWLTDQKEMVLIESICDTLRDCVYGVLFTVPDQRTLSRRIRTYDDYLVRIHQLKIDEQKHFNGDTSNLRVARLYKKTITPASQVRIYKQYYDTYNVMLPFWVYEKYKEKRHRYTKENIRDLKAHLQKNSS